MYRIAHRRWQREDREKLHASRDALFVMRTEERSCAEPPALCCEDRAPGHGFPIDHWRYCRTSKSGCPAIRSETIKGEAIGRRTGRRPPICSAEHKRHHLGDPPQPRRRWIHVHGDAVGYILRFLLSWPAPGLHLVALALRRPSSPSLIGDAPSVAHLQRLEAVRTDSGGLDRQRAAIAVREWRAKRAARRSVARRPLSACSGCSLPRNPHSKRRDNQRRELVDDSPRLTRHRRPTGFGRFC